MKYLDFVEKLENVPFEKTSYEEIGLDDDFIEENRQKFFLSKIDHSATESEDEVLGLLNNYDVSGLEIGMVTFQNRTVENGEYLVIGRFEEESIVIHRPSNEIRLLSPTDNSIGSYCASNGEKFLDALLEAAKYLEKRMVDEALYDDQEFTTSMVNMCANLAGGTKYTDFYKVLFGSEE